MKMLSRDNVVVQDLTLRSLMLTDSSGAIQTRYSYEPYGKTTQSGTASTNSFQYTGRENDGTGLYYYRARHYSPGLQRFVSEDPIGLAAGPNLYAYVGGNPISRIDPLGLWTLQVGGTVSFNWNGAVYQFSGGFAFDGNGNIGTFTASGPGVGAGDEASIGTTVLYSPNAATIGALNGPFVNGSIGAGLGPAGSIDWFKDPASPVWGAGATIGAGIGGGGTVSRTTTVVTPIHCSK